MLDEIEIVRLNVERYRRMLQSELDETARQIVETLLAESELALLQARARPTHGNLTCIKSGLPISFML